MSGKGGPELKKFMDKKVMRECRRPPLPPEHCRPFAPLRRVRDPARPGARGRAGAIVRLARTRVRGTLAGGARGRGRTHSARARGNIACAGRSGVRGWDPGRGWSCVASTAPPCRGSPSAQWLRSIVGARH